MKYPDIPNVTKEYLDEVRPAINAGGSCSATAGATIGALSPPLVVDGTSIDIDASGVPVASINSYSVGQCTWWAAARRQQIGKPVDPYMGHGYMWAASAERHGYPIGGTIQLGDVMSFERGVLGASGEYGHVAIVEEIHVFLVKSVFRVSSLIFFGFRHEECRPVVCFTGCPSCRT